MGVLRVVSCSVRVCVVGVRVSFRSVCVQFLRGGVRFPNEVGVCWPSVFGGPNPMALHSSLGLD